MPANITQDHRFTTSTTTMMIYSTQTLTPIPIPIQTHKNPAENSSLSSSRPPSRPSSPSCSSSSSASPSPPSSSSSSSSSLENLPRKKYASGSDASVKEDCAVCLEAFRDDEWCRSLPKCLHLFHASCVDRWLTKVADCPGQARFWRLRVGHWGR
ncbi:hypothetical protein Acr_18g0008920 [Actinidia rufa]|uniref:RING-type domain-containing protein n=1 Tax=Actinidia rufa TaxID=165716 RepID=A0A7J0G7M3_9ERIC|nr:hypothetical protein Acr_18g0008920 [Actinidia rufa]